MRKTQVAVQSRGPGNTHREGTYLQLGSPAYAYACGCVLAYADKRLTIFKYSKAVCRCSECGDVVRWLPYPGGATDYVGVKGKNQKRENSSQTGQPWLQPFIQNTTSQLVLPAMNSVPQLGPCYSNSTCPYAGNGWQGSENYHHLPRHLARLGVHPLRALPLLLCYCHNYWLGWLAGLLSQLLAGLSCSQLGSR